MTDRNELERLLAAATEGPWEPEYDPIGDSDEHATAIYLPGFAGQIGTFIAYCQHNWNDAYAGEHRISWKEATSNAALICFLRNNAQHYLSLMDEVEEWKQNFIAFAGPAAAHYARTFDLPDGHLHPQHYDLLKRAGARMDSFTRAEIGETHDN